MQHLTLSLSLALLKGKKQGKQNILQAVMLLLEELDKDDLAKVQGRVKDLLH